MLGAMQKPRFKHFCSQTGILQSFPVHSFGQAQVFVEVELVVNLLVIDIELGEVRQLALHHLQLSELDEISVLPFFDLEYDIEVSAVFVS